MSYLSVRRTLCLAGTLTLPASPMFAQMYNQQTIYTDGDTSASPSLHVWGYTYAPSGSSVIHNYHVSTSVTLPSGKSAQNSGSGSGYSPAKDDVWIDTSGETSDALFNISSDHTAYCPFFYSGTIPFLNRFTYPVDFAVKFTTAKTSGASVPGPGPLNKTCAASSACSNTSTPACPIKAIIRPTTSPCSGYFRVGCLAERPYGTTTWFCTPGLVISAPSQPSYCSPQ